MLCLWISLLLLTISRILLLYCNIDIKHMFLSIVDVRHSVHVSLCVVNEATYLQLKSTLHYSVGLSRQRSMVRASTASLLFLVEVFKLCTCSPQGFSLEWDRRELKHFFSVRHTPASTLTLHLIDSYQSSLTISLHGLHSIFTLLFCLDFTVLLEVTI